MLLTLHHFNNPLWLEERGGFAQRDNITCYLRFVRKMVEPAPFHPHAVALDAHILHEFQILPPPLIVVHSGGGIAVILDISPAVPVASTLPSTSLTSMPTTGIWREPGLRDGRAFWK